MPVRGDSESWQQVLDDAHARINELRAAKGAPPLTLSQCPILLRFQGYTETTWQAGMARVLKDPQVRANWLYVIRTRFSDWLSNTLRLAVTRKIAESGHPMAAARLYVEEPTLSDEEDQELLAAFRDKLPTIERALNSGALTREKAAA